MNKQNIIIKIILFLFVTTFFSACTVADISPTNISPTDISSWPIIGKYLSKNKTSTTKVPTDQTQTNPITKEPVTLTYWGLYVPKEVMDPLIKKYQETHPNVTINYEEQKPTTIAEYKEKVATRITSGSGPDIFRAHNSWFGYLNNIMAPLSAKVMTEQQYLDRFYNIALQSSKIGGQIYGIPLEYDQLILIYNKDLFSEAGIVKPPETWEEFRLNAIKLTKKDGTGAISQAGAGVGVVNNVQYATDILGYMFSQSDVTIPNFLDDPAALSVVNYYKGLADSDNVWSLNLPNTATSFANGKVAMIFGTTETVRDILSINKNVNMGITNAPQVPSLEGSNNLTDTYWANFWMETVSKNSKNADVAWDFLKFLSEDEQQKEYRNSLKLFETAVPPFGNKALNSSISEEFILPVIKGADKATSGLIADCAGNLSYRDAVASVISGTQTLAEAKTTIESLLASSNIGTIGTAENCPLILSSNSTGNTPPEIVPSTDNANLTSTPLCKNLSATVNGYSVDFTATVENAIDSNGYGVNYGDGTTATVNTKSFSYTYLKDGTYLVTFTPVSGDGNVQSCTTTVTITNNTDTTKVAPTVTGDNIETGTSPIIIYLLALGLFLVGIVLVKQN